MRSILRSIVATGAATSLALLTLAACTGEEADEPEVAEEIPVEDPAGDDEPTATQSSPDDAKQTPSEDPSDDETGGFGDGSPAPWASPVAAEGDLLATIEAGDVLIEAYQVDQTESTRDSMWVDPDTDEPIVKEGDEVMVINYVVTNNGDPVTLNYGLVDIRFDYESWPYAQQPSVADISLMEGNGVNDNGVASGFFDQDVWVLGAGEQYAVGEVMLYLPGDEYSISAKVTNRDEAGEVLDEVEGQVTGTME